MCQMVWLSYLVGCSEFLNVFGTQQGFNDRCERAGTKVVCLHAEMKHNKNHVDFLTMA